jgi:hypothetical protein
MAGEAAWVDTSQYQESEGKIGLTVRLRNSGFEFASVAPGSASAKAGVQPGDVLLSVNECAVTQNLSLDTVGAMLKGKPGSWVKLTLQRNSLWNKNVFDVMVQREGPAAGHIPPCTTKVGRVPHGSHTMIRGGLPGAALPRGGLGAPKASESTKSDPLEGPFNSMDLSLSPVVTGFNNGVKAITEPLIHSIHEHARNNAANMHASFSMFQPPAPPAPVPPPLERFDSMNLPPQGGLVGLVNMGNTCFLNSIVQCLVHAVPLASFIVFSLEDPPPAQSAPPEKEASAAPCASAPNMQELEPPRPPSTGVLAAFKVLASHIWSGEHKDAIQAKSLLDALRSDKRSSALFNHRQQDAHECLCVLLDALHQDTNGALQSDECRAAARHRRSSEDRVAGPRASGTPPYGHGASTAGARDGLGDGDGEWVQVEDDVLLVEAPGARGGGADGGGGCARSGERVSEPEIRGEASSVYIPLRLG